MDQQARRRYLPTALFLISLAIPGIALAATINCPSSGACNGTSGDDVINGTDNRNVIEAGYGSDRPVTAMKGPDEVHGSYGYDTLYGGNGDDVMFGGENGTSSWDRLVGGDGNDSLDDSYAGSHNTELDALCGGPKHDWVTTNDIGQRTGSLETDYFQQDSTGNDDINADGWDTGVNEATCEG